MQFTLMGMALPFYKIVVNEHDDTGVDFNAFVDAPAHMKGFIAFGKDTVRYDFNDEKRIVTGVMISVGTPIYRRDDQFGEHYVVFDVPTVDLICKKFFKQGFNQNLNADHDSSKVLSAVLISSYIASNSDDKLPNIPQAFENLKLQDGTWIASYYIEDDKTWNDVKNGKFNGFSVEGWFDKVKINVAEKMKIAKFNQVTSITKWDITIDQKDIKEGDKLTRTEKYSGKTNIVRLEAGEYLTKEGTNILVDADGVVQKMGFRKVKQKQMKNKLTMWDSIKAKFSKEEKTENFAQATTAEGVVVMYDGELTTGVQLTIEADGVQTPIQGDETLELTLEDGTVKIVVTDENGAVASVEDFQQEEKEVAPTVDNEELKSEIMEAIFNATKLVSDEAEERFSKLESELKSIKSGEKFKTNPNKGAAEGETKKLTSSQILQNQRNKNK